MPTPIDLLLHPVSLASLAIYLTLMLWEYTFPARRLVSVPKWPLRGLIAFAVYFLMSSYLPMFWDGALASHRLFDLSGFSTLTQFAVGLFTYEFVHYWWHRSMHRFNFLWRGFHQMHHSAERLDTFGAFWLSPLDMLGFIFASSFALVFVVGLNPTAATATMLTLTFLAIFQHANIKTPRWLGYLVQRPESHSHHHAHGVHQDNYADLPIYDIIFGTFRNPKAHLDTGFYYGASKRVVDMLLFRDLNRNENVEMTTLPPVQNA